MKRFGLICICLFLLFALVPGAALAQLPVEVDGERVQFNDQEPFIDSSSRALVPLRAVLEKMGASVSWDSGENAAVITRDNTRVVFTLDSNLYTLDGEPLAMDTAPVAVNNRICLPIRYAAEALGAFVRWNSSSGSIEVWVNEIPPIIEETMDEIEPWSNQEPGQNQAPEQPAEPGSQEETELPSDYAVPGDNQTEDSGYASTINVSTVQELRAAIETANLQGSTRILLADGDYALDDTLYVTAPGISVEGASGKRDAVVLHGPCFQIFGVAAPDFQLKNLSAGNVESHAVQVHGEDDADRPQFINVRFFDTGEQMLKVSYDDSSPAGSDFGRVEGCLFEYTAGVGPQWYIGGVDAHQAEGWVVRGNCFIDIRSPEEDLAEHAIHFWSGSRDTIVEKNVIINCDRGIGFGLGDRGHYGGLICNNMIFTSRDVGIGLENASGARVYNNSLWTENYMNSIEYRFSGSRDIEIINNVCNMAIAERDGASALLDCNMEGTEYGWFVDPAAGDLRWNGPEPGVVDQGLSLEQVEDDIDGVSRPQGLAYDLGAQEWNL